MTGQFDREMNSYFNSYVGAYTTLSAEEIRKGTYNVKAVIRDILIKQLGKEAIPKSDAESLGERYVTFRVCPYSNFCKSEKIELRIDFSKKDKDEVSIYFLSEHVKDYSADDYWYIYFGKEFDCPYIGIMKEQEWLEHFGQFEIEDLQIRPYARLITMLGDQLIKNEVIALTELIKNAYDADAEFVKVSFVNFNEDYTANNNSKIIIEDDGCGMSEDILRNHWLNPATPIKLKKKKTNSYTPKGRIIQGEKGIGRFSIFKLGQSIDIFTRRRLVDKNGQYTTKGEKSAFSLRYDFTKYDTDFLSENGEEKNLYIGDLPVKFTKSIPYKFEDKRIRLGLASKRRKPYGTIIEITSLKTAWSKKKVENVIREINKLQPIFSEESDAGFAVYFTMNGKDISTYDQYLEDVRKILDSKSVLRVTKGFFDCSNNTYFYELNGEKANISFSSSEISGLSLFKKNHMTEAYCAECGSFHFQFNIFDLNASIENGANYYLDEKEKEIIKQHRIYLYRDNIRVMPYGAPEDDWLGIDIGRSTVKAGSYFSNDQIVGCIYISQKDNPRLKDKTNREGLIEEGNAFGDFRLILQLFLMYLRGKVYARYLITKERRDRISSQKNGSVSDAISSAKVKYQGNTEISHLLDTFAKKYENEKNVLLERIRKTENLAAVGLSIETGSHDMMMLVKRAVENQNGVISYLEKNKEVDYEYLKERLKEVVKALSMVELQMRDIQLLFPSTKLRVREIKISDILSKVKNLYNHALDDNGINVYPKTFKTDLAVKCTEAVLLQVFINLFDNALYWLKTVNRDERKIDIVINNIDKTVTFSDNGPGIKEEDYDFIFEAFFSGKGVEGRGLGLYVARQLLDRYGYSIDVQKNCDSSEQGATFIISFEVSENEY